MDIFNVNVNESPDRKDRFTCSRGKCNNGMDKISRFDRLSTPFYKFDEDEKIKKVDRLDRI